MGKRTKEYYKMMETFNRYLSQAAQPNQWETALGNEVNRRMSRSSGDIMGENLGKLSEWQRRYDVGSMPDTSPRNKAYGLAYAKQKDLGARELAQNYGRLGEESVTNYRNQTLGMMGNMQGIESGRMTNALQGALAGAQSWNNFKPKKGWWDTIIGGAMDLTQLGTSIFGMRNAMRKK